MSAGHRGHIASYEQAIHDAEQFLDFVLTQQRGTPVFLAGSSWAAKMAIVLAANRQADLDGLLLLGPGLFARIDLTLQQKLLVLAGHRFGHRQHVQIPLYPALYTRTPRWVDYIHDDPNRLMTASTRFYWETRRLDWARERYAARLRLPVMVQMGTADRIADADATAAWVDRLPSGDRARYLYAGASHTLDFEPEPLVSVYRADLLAWLDEHISQAEDRTEGHREASHAG